MNLHSKHLKTLQTLFSKHPTIAQALLFGSRALGTHKESSDIDIVLKGDITPTLLAHLKEELEDSTLPYFCDILDYERAPQELKEHIDIHALTLYKREEEWQEVRLGDMVEINKNNLGKNFEYENILYLDTGSITRNQISSLQTFHISNAPSRAKRLLGKRNIVYSMVRPIQRHFGFIENPPKNLVVSTGFVVIEEKENSLIDLKYLYYFLTLDEKVEFFESIAEGSTSTYPSLKPSDLAELTIPLPPLERQKEIAEILSSFDDKIDFLYRQNRTLESLAQTLFRHYFIDNAKEEWEEKLLSDFGTIVCGKTPSKNNKSYYGGNYPFIKIPDMHGNIFVFSTADTLTQEGADSQKNKILPPLSICVSCIATVGLVSMNATEAQTNQQINSIIPHKPHYRYYLFLSLQSLYDELHALASGGTATLYLNRGDFSKIKIPMPSDEELLGFNNETEAIFSRIFENQKKSITLKNTQNLVLQRLLDER